MSNALTINASMGLVSLPIVNQSINPGQIVTAPTTPVNSAGVMSVPTTAGGTAIPLNGLTTLGYAQFINLDGTHDIHILNAVSGSTILAILKPKGTALLFLGVAAPAAIAITGACQMNYIITDGS